MDELSIADYESFELVCEFIKRVLIEAKSYEKNSSRMEGAVAMKILQKHSAQLVSKVLMCVYSQPKNFIPDLAEILTVIESMDKAGTKEVMRLTVNSKLGKIRSEIRENFLNDFSSAFSIEDKTDVLITFHGMCQLHYIKNN
ncbi:hypothetical protein MHBO_002999 [Bonamia ostreae]|uniref:Uncharacterized protein n=1 Tax=Bonamia ostreae TaxID=126728 RepID=A0ABV2AP72_9EUKA